MPFRLHYVQKRQYRKTGQVQISILRVVYLVAVLLPPLLVMLKVGIVINDALRQENSGEKLLLRGDIMRNAPRMNKTAIMPYLLVPKVK